MKPIQIFKLVCYFTLLTVGVARGQVFLKGPRGQVFLMGPSDGRLVLYRLDGSQGRYLLSMSYDYSDGVKTSVVAIGDTFSVKPSAGGVCDVVMSNVYILQTTYGRAPSNEVKQIQFRTDAYTFSFPMSTKLILDNSVVDLPKVKIDAFAGGKAKTYEGKAALDQYRKMGLKPPDDIDMEKAVGHKDK